MGLVKGSSIKKRLYLSFACMWAIMIFFAFFRGQQLGAVMSRYNMAIETLNVQQQYIGDIVTSLNMLHFSDLIFGALGDYPELHRRISPMLLDRDIHIESLYQALYNYRRAVLTEGILTSEEAEIHIAILRDMLHRLDYYYIPASNAMRSALEAGDADRFSDALFINIYHGNYLTGQAWELRDRTFMFVDYVKDTMLYYDQIEDRIFNVATVIGISIAIFLAVILAYTIQKPISELKAAMTEVASGNMAHPIRMDYNDDIGRLSHDIADMVESVSEIVETSAAQKYRIEQEERERKAEAAEYRRAIEQQRAEAAEENNRIKDRFLAKMSHELRTPITAVLGISEIELRKAKHEKGVSELFAKIYKSSRALLGIVNDLLDISKIDDDSMEVVSVKYNTLEMLDDFTLLHLVYTDSKDIQFEFSVDENIPCALVGDALRIRQVVNNLLSNAFKYTEVGTVSLCVKWNGYALIISVRDTGLGMSLEQQEQVFEEYSRFHERQLNTMGTGLGMAITRALVHKMDGTIKLESEEGTGTHVVLELPQGIADAEPLGKEVAQKFRSFEHNMHVSANLLDTPPEQMPYGKVLVVDDVEINLYVAEAMLETFGVSIELCESGKLALEKIENGNVYDVIFLDHMMPELDGVEVVQILRERGYDHPIVALTANAVKGQEEFFLSSGFSAFMPKPIEYQLLHTLLIRFVKDKHDAKNCE